MRIHSGPLTVVVDQRPVAKKSEPFILYLPRSLNVICPISPDISKGLICVHILVLKVQSASKLERSSFQGVRIVAMDVKSRYLLITLFVAMTVSILFTYWRYVIRFDYAVEVPADPADFVTGNS